MSSLRVDRRVVTAVALGAVAVVLGLAATVTEARPGPLSHAGGSATSELPVAPPPTPASDGTPTTTPDPDAVDATTATPPPLVEIGADGVLRADGHVIVNKSFPLPPEFGPDGLDPALVAAFDAMRAEAAAAGLSLRIVSGHRTFAHQQQNYSQRVAQVGQETADRGMARPGHSEHQTGLAIDVNDLSPSFGQTPEGLWVAANASRFGFVVRYPDGKEGVTGFKYEPWHLRYLGVELATTLATAGLTVEEYYGLPSAY